MFSFLCLAACGLILSGASAQKTSGDKVTVKVTSNGKVISDTTFQLKEGQDPEAVKEVISRVLAGDIEVITDKEGDQQIIWVTSGDAKHMCHSEDIETSMDTCTKHMEMVMTSGEEEPGSKVIIIKDKGGRESDDHGKTIKIYVEGGNDAEVFGDDDMELHMGKDADDTDVIIIKSDDGTKVIKKVKKIEVTVEDENKSDDNSPAPPAEIAPKPDKKKR